MFGTFNKILPEFQNTTEFINMKYFKKSIEKEPLPLEFMSIPKSKFLKICFCPGYANTRSEKLRNTCLY